MKTILLVIITFFCCTTYSQTVLKSGDSLVHSINYGDVHVYKVKISKGAFYRLAVFQKGIDLQIILKSPHARDTVFDSPNGITGTEPIAFLASANGYAVMNVMPLADSSNTKTGEYTIKYEQQLIARDYTAKLKQKEAEKAEFIDWIKQNAVSIASVKPNQTFQDLDFLRPLLMNKRVIGLGEATHGTQEFFQLKHRMLEFLVTQIGVSVFGIEASYGRCKYINNYVLSGNGNLDTATIIQGFATWSTEEFRDLIQWMREYNKLHPVKKIQFVGFDLQVTDAVEFAIHNYYKRVDSSKIAVVDTLLKRVRNLETTGGIFSGDTTVKTVIGPVEKLIAEFVEKEGEYVWKSSKAEYEEMLWNHKILHQLVVDLSFDNFNEEIKKEDRDFFMAQNVLAWLAHFPKDTKMMIWAHNGHIAKDYLDALSVPSMGSYLHKVLKDDYYAIGFDFYKGKFRSNDIDLPNSPGWEENEVGNAPEGNLSFYFIQAGLGNSFLDFSRTSKNDNIKRWLTEKDIGTYSMGSQFSKKWTPSRYISPMKIQAAFDGMFFIKESHSAVSIKSFAIDTYKF